LDVGRVGSVYADLAARAAAALVTDGFDPAAHRLLRTADLRYAGQAYEVRVPAPDGPVDAGFAAAVADGFHAGHEQLYGYSFAGRADQRVEWVNLRVTGVGPIDRPKLAELARGEYPDAGRAWTGTRPVCFDERGFVETPVYWRPDLLADDGVSGPAIIEEYGSTVPVHPGFHASVDGFGNLVVTR